MSFRLHPAGMTNLKGIWQITIQDLTLDIMLTTSIMRSERIVMFLIVQIIPFSNSMNG